MPLAHQVGAAVAHVDGVEHALLPDGGDQGGPGRGGALLADLGVGGEDCLAQVFGGIAAGLGVVGGGQGGNDQVRFIGCGAVGQGQ